MKEKILDDLVLAVLVVISIIIGEYFKFTLILQLVCSIIFAIVGRIIYDKLYYKLKKNNRTK